MPAPRDRYPYPFILEQDYPDNLPLPPLNVFVQSGLEPQTQDIRWTPPTELSANTRFNIIGVNIYRSFDSEYGPYTRLNLMPCCANYFRDKTTITVAVQEDVSNAFIGRGPGLPLTDPDSRYFFRVKNRPIYLQVFPDATDVTNLNVHVTVNGIDAFVETIYAAAGEVELRTYPTFNPANQTQVAPVLPLNPNDVVLATYKYRSNFVRTDLSTRIFYRLTTVAFDSNTGLLIETPLERGAQGNNQEVEKLDYIWREAIRRSRWILNQGGERVKIFIRKSVGPKCGCYSDTHKQPSADCLVCYGTSIIGGFDGPFDTIIAPDDGEKNVSQSFRGRSLNHTYSTWTVPSPLVSQRDFLVKLNGDRYGIGPVRMPSNRGMQLLQFFDIGHLDEQDIKYKIPVLDTAFLRAPQTRYLVPGRGAATPEMTRRLNIPEEREIKSATVTGENVNRK